MVFKNQESKGEIYLEAGAEEVLVARPVAEKMERVDRVMGHNFEEEPTGHNFEEEPIGLSRRLNVACEDIHNVHGSTL